MDKSKLHPGGFLTLITLKFCREEYSCKLINKVKIFRFIKNKKFFQKSKKCKENRLFPIFFLHFKICLTKGMI